MIKKYGEDAFITGDQFLDQDRQIISVSPKLDMILGGGVPEGSFVILAGPPKVGKTVTALHLAGNAQKLGRKVFYFNIEGRIKPRDIHGIKSLDASQMEIIRSYKNDEGQSKILLAHEFLDIAERRIKDVPGSVIIIDSASQLLTETEANSDMGDKARAPGAVLLSQFCRRISNVLPVNGNIVIMIVHVIANTGGGHKTKTTSGGNKIQYAVDVNLEALYQQPWVVGGTKNAEGQVVGGTQIGQRVFWKSLSTGIAPPGMTTDSSIKYGIGIDEVYEAFELGKTLGLIDRAGAWYKLTYLNEGKEDEKPIQFQGEEKAMAAIYENQEWSDKLLAKVKEFTS